VVSRERSWLRRVRRIILLPLALVGLLWLAPAASPGPLDSLPSISYTIDGITGTNGWYRGSTGGDYVVVRWSVSGADNTDCQIAIRIDGPNGGTTRSCSASNATGTVSATTKLIKIDADAPTGVAAAAARLPDQNGWYRNPVTVNWTGSDATSGPVSCTSVSYSGPDGASIAPSGTCTDQAGNTSAPLTLPNPLKYDSTPPVFSPSADRAPNPKGWYRSAVTVAWHGSDKMSGIASCPASGTYSSPDSANAGLNATCTDQAGNSASTSVSLKYDSTAPVANSAGPGRSPDANGWYRNPVTIDWSGSDATSGPVSCTSLSYNGPDGGNIAPSGTCTDQAGNTSSPLTLPNPIKYDATAPRLAPSPDRAPNAKGWYRSPVTVTWNGSDATSGIASCPNTSSYNTGDSANAGLSATCTDQAGNSASASFALKYDSTPPVFAPTPDRSPNANGWYRSPVTVTWNGSDATSGIASCPNTSSYNTGDSANAGLSATCTDQAGNSASASFALKYDSTAPVTGSASPARLPDVNGWYNHQVAINWSGSDATSGPVSCTSLSYNGPDGSSVAPSGTCTDQAGNTSTPLTLPSPIQFDATAPTGVGAVPARGPDHNGWYTQPVAITWSGSDPTSGIAGCSSLTYSGPDSGSAGPSGGCTDKAGNTASATFPLQFDATAPAVVPSPARSPDSNGWYDHPVAVGWAGSDSASGVESCTDASIYGGPDSAGVTLAGACTDKAGNSGSSSFQLSYDATAPAVSARAERGPDHDGWYNRPVKIDFIGTDALSGVDSCTSMTYSGPFIKSIEPVGSCRDRAGNNTFVSFPLDYDAEPPTLSGLTVESTSAAEIVRWKSSSRDDVATVSRVARGGGSATVFRGGGATFVDKKIQPGVEYRFSVQTEDPAGNKSRQLSRLALPKVVSLRTRGYVARTAGAPVLRLPAVAGASYYHVQLFRQGKRILAAWPLKPQLALHTSWSWSGRSYRLTRGRYRWFAWAGFGPRSAARYKLLGSARFIVAQP
jgi:large repetitive protein